MCLQLELLNFSIGQDLGQTYKCLCLTNILNYLFEMLHLANQQTSFGKLLQSNCYAVIQEQNEEEACNLSPSIVYPAEMGITLI